MASVSINNDQRQILAMFARGRDEEFISTGLHLPYKLVNDTIVLLAEADPDRARELVAAYDRQQATNPVLESPPAPSPPPAAPKSKRPKAEPCPSTTAGAKTTPTATSAPSAAAPAPATTPESALDASTWAPPRSPASSPAPATRSILERAAGSGNARTRALADKAHQLLADLHARVEAEEAERLAKATQARERAEAERRVTELQQLLAEAQSKLRGLAGRRPVNSPNPAAPAASTGRDHEPAVVRAWAAENGVECSPNGRVPRAVVDAWRTATGAA